MSGKRIDEWGVDRASEGRKIAKQRAKKEQGQVLTVLGVIAGGLLAFFAGKRVKAALNEQRASR